MKEEDEKKMVVNYNDKMDTIYITVNRQTTPRLFEEKVRYIMRVLNMGREEAERFCEEREGWKVPLSLMLDDGQVFAIESEALYSDENAKTAPYTGRAIEISYEFTP